MAKKTNPDEEEEGRDKIPTQTWEDDQRRRESYYDDAHGYQRYEPAQEEEPSNGEQEEEG